MAAAIMQMVAEFKEKQIGTPFVRGGAPEGREVGGWVGQGGPSQHYTHVPFRYFSTPPELDNSSLKWEVSFTCSSIAIYLSWYARASAAQTLPHNFAATHLFSAVNMQPDGELKTEQIGALMVRVGSLEGFKVG
eukprot:288208-Pelagomonas_calceolata.AAC.8